VVRDRKESERTKLKWEGERTKLKREGGLHGWEGERQGRRKEGKKSGELERRGKRVEMRHVERRERDPEGRGWEGEREREGGREGRKEGRKEREKEGGIDGWEGGRNERRLGSWKREGININCGSAFCHTVSVKQLHFYVTATCS